MKRATGHSAVKTCKCFEELYTHSNYDHFTDRTSVSQAAPLFVLFEVRWNLVSLKATFTEISKLFSHEIPLHYRIIRLSFPKSYKPCLANISKTFENFKSLCQACGILTSRSGGSPAWNTSCLALHF